MGAGRDVLNVGSGGCEIAVRIGTEDPVHLVDIGVVERQCVDRLVGKGDRVIGLLVLAPADVADERGVVIDDALASEFRGRVKALVLEYRLVELVGLRIRDEGVAGIKGSRANRAAMIIINDGLGEFTLRSRR